MSASIPRTRAKQEAIIGENGLGRCPWAVGQPANLRYHDTEWGMPVRGEQALYERASLEASQSGLSWLTILIKRQEGDGPDSSQKPADDCPLQPRR